MDVLKGKIDRLEQIRERLKKAHKSYGCYSGDLLDDIEHLLTEIDKRERLARLGAAAEKAIGNGAMFTQFFDDSGASMCNPDVDAYGENCDYRCQWQDFCRIRSEKGAG